MTNGALTHENLKLEHLSSPPLSYCISDSPIEQQLKPTKKMLSKDSIVIMISEAFCASCGGRGGGGLRARGAADE